MEKLKPCPFCGGTPLLSEGPYHWEFVGRYYYSATIECTCGLTLEVDNPGPKVYTRDAEALNFAINAWNKRAERTCTRDNGFCSSCGLYHDDGIAYCPYCGAKVVDV